MLTGYILSLWDRFKISLPPDYARIYGGRPNEDDIHENLELGTALIIFGGGISLGLAMDNSGSAAYFANLFFPIVKGGGGLLVGEALNLTGGNRFQAAKLLGMYRPTLHAKIDKYDLKIETSVK